MAQMCRIVFRIAVGLVFLTAAVSASAEELLNRDAGFQKGLAIGAALAYQAAELGFGEVPAENDAMFGAPRRVGFSGAPTSGDADALRLSDLLGFTKDSARAPAPRDSVRPYSLADALSDWHWRRKGASGLRERLN